MPLIDARGRARFEGTEADPRGNPRRAHSRIAQSALRRCIGEDGLKSNDALRAEFEAAWVDPGTVHRQLRVGVPRNSLIFAARRLGAGATNFMMEAGRNMWPIRTRPRN